MPARAHVASRPWPLVAARPFCANLYRTRYAPRTAAVQDQHNNVARYLESKGHLENALQVAVDPDYRCGTRAVTQRSVEMYCPDHVLF